MAIVLNKAADAHDAVQCAAGFIAHAGAKLRHAHGKVAVALQSLLINFNVTGTVHRFEGEGANAVTVTTVAMIMTAAGFDTAVTDFNDLGRLIFAGGAILFVGDDHFGDILPSGPSAPIAPVVVGQGF